MEKTLSLIRNTISSLKKAERSVGESILQDPYNIIESTITELAEKAGVSEPTVVRFCRKIGLKGYMELRLNLARDLPAPVYGYETVADEDSPVQILEKTITCHHEELRNALNAIDVTRFTNAIDLLSAATQIDLYGFGGSGLVAMDAWHKFFRLGIPCNTYKDAHLHLIGASLLKPGSVVIAISIHGSAIDLIDAVKVAKKSGASIIGITGSKRTPLDRHCDVVFPLICQEPAPWVYRLTARLAQIALLDALFIGVTVRKNSKGKKDMVKIQKTITGKNF